MNMTIDLKNALPFIGGSISDELRSDALKGLDTLVSGSGAGNDFIGWLKLGDGSNSAEIEAIKVAAKQIRSDSEALVVIGIGGSYLGAKAGLDFICSPNYNCIKKDTPDIYFAGNGLSADATYEIIEMLGDRDFSVNIISKSGTTTEPAVAFRIFRELLEKKYGAEGAAKRIYATTDKARGVLKGLSDVKGYTTFVVPDDVGGRFSVFTPVGLLPLAVAGIDPDVLLGSFVDAVKTCTTPDFDNNPALQYAAVRNALYRDGKTVEVFAAFEPSLRFVGEWWKQLYGESEGKENKGLFPASVDLTADLHSMGQFLQEGTRIMFETFVKIENSRYEMLIKEDAENADKLNFMAGKTVTWANHMAMAATTTAHMDGGVPNLTLTLPERSAETFAALCGFFEVACGISGYMLEVNPFNQPGVEAYKNFMYALLGKPGYDELRAELSARGIG